jgi:hemerythrin-like domain-containing protein
MSDSYAKSTPAHAGAPQDRARSLGGQLAEVHQWLRAELARLREELATYAGSDPVRSPTLLRVHCTAFCQALTRHHTSEDTTGFAALGEQFPELIPVLEELRQDHRLVADILRRLQELLTTLTPDNAEPVRRELDGLTAILESHFQWEERRLLDAFDALRTPAASEDLFGPTDRREDEHRR